MGVISKFFESSTPSIGFRGTFTADRSGAVGAFLGKQVAEAVEAVGEVVARGEPLASQLLLAADADEALLVPGLVAVVYPSSGDRLVVKGQKWSISFLK